MTQIKKIESTYNVFTQFRDGDLVLGSSSIDSLLSSRVNISLKPFINSRFNYSANEFYIPFKDKLRIQNNIKIKNENSTILSKYSNMPIFDINVFYKNILSGKVTTSDGIKVDGNWPNGNFFSTDGVYPSAFGQAVIANEVIKVINSHYNTDIELINTRQFLNK